MAGWLFPGQASQKVGMGLDLKENSEKARKYFEISNDIMECDIPVSYTHLTLPTILRV